MENEQKILQLYYDYAVKLLFQEQSLLFQRAHYFLIANSFLVAALATIYYKQMPNELLIALPALGILIAILQFSTGVLNSQRLKVCRNFIFDIEKERNIFPEIHKHGQMVRPLQEEIYPPFSEILRELDPTIKLRWWHFGAHLDRSFHQVLLHGSVIP